MGDRVAPIFFRRWLDGDTPPPAAYGSVLDGALADHMVLHEDGLVHLPSYLDDEEASTIGCAAVTAWHALVTSGRVRAGETILVQGTGGVSIFALQFALLAGARVLATSSSDEKLERVRALGAWETVNYVTTPEWADRTLHRWRKIGSKPASRLRPGGPVTFCSPIRSRSIFLAVTWRFIDGRLTMLAASIPNTAKPGMMLIFAGDFNKPGASLLSARLRSCGIIGVLRCRRF